MCELHNMPAFDLLSGLTPGSVDLILSDQPYETTRLAFDAQPVDYERLFELSWRALTPNGWLILFGRGRFVASLMLRPEFLYERVWLKTRKTGGLNTPIRPLIDHEWVLHFNRSRSNGTYNPQIMTGYEPKGHVRRGGGGNHWKTDSETTYEDTDGSRHPTTQMRYDEGGLEHPNPTRQNGVTHPTAKPLGLLSELILTHTNEGDLVVDPYNGGDANRASTAEAAYMAARRFVGSELDVDTWRASKRRLDTLTAQPSLFALADA